MRSHHFLASVKGTVANSLLPVDKRIRVTKGSGLGPLPFQISLSNQEPNWMRIIRFETICPLYKKQLHKVQFMTTLINDTSNSSKMLPFIRVNDTYLFLAQRYQNLNILLIKYEMNFLQTDRIEFTINDRGI